MIGTTEKGEGKKSLLPLDDFEVLGRRMDKWFDSVLSGWPVFTGSVVRRLAGPTLDIEDKGDHYQVKADLPGMKKEEIKVSLHGSTLILEGSRESEKKEEDKKKGYYRSERFFGEFRRVVDLPGEVDKGKTEARYENGVLTLKLPKQASKGDDARDIKIS